MGLVAERTNVVEGHPPRTSFGSWSGHINHWTAQCTPERHSRVYYVVIMVSALNKKSRTVCTDSIKASPDRFSLEKL
jgi:hypothetical protein